MNQILGWCMHDEAERREKNNIIKAYALSEEATIGKRGIAPSFLVILTKSCNW